MVLPALIFAAALNLLLGFEMFGIPLVLGDPSGILVLTTYTYKLTTLFGVPTYQLMAVVAVRADPDHPAARVLPAPPAAPQPPLCRARRQGARATS